MCVHRPRWGGWGGGRRGTEGRVYLNAIKMSMIIQTAITPPRINESLLFLKLIFWTRLLINGNRADNYKSAQLRITVYAGQNSELCFRWENLLYGLTETKLIHIVIKGYRLQLPFSLQHRWTCLAGGRGSPWLLWRYWLLRQLVYQSCNIKSAQCMTMSYT